MSHATQARPVCAFFKPQPRTPPARLAKLTVAARSALCAAPDGLTLAELAEQLVATDSETHDAVRALEPAVTFFWAGRGWRLRLRSDREQRLLAAANDNVRPARVLTA